MLNLRAPEFRQNPYPFFQRLRATAPVCRIEPHGFWAVSRHQDVMYVLKNPELFSSAGINDEPPIAGPELFLSTRGMVAQDRPDHTRLRKHLRKAFTSDTIKSLEPFIKSVVRALIDDIVQKEQFDFVQDFSLHLPILVICYILGLDPSRKTDIKRWSDTMLSFRAVALTEEKKREIKADMNNLYDFIMEALNRKKRQPENDIISSLLQPSSKNDELSKREILSFIRLLLVAGTDTTTHLLGNTILAFIKYPELYVSIKTNPELIPGLVEESLRFDSPVQCLMRRASADIDIAEVTIRKNDLVLAFVASANHDENIYKKPDQFIINRMPQQHLTFGAGIHFCMGSQIARLQARIAFRELLQHFDSWRRADSGPLLYFNSIFFRGLTSLRIKRS